MKNSKELEKDVYKDMHPKEDLHPAINETGKKFISDLQALCRMLLHNSCALFLGITFIWVFAEFRIFQYCDLRCENFLVCALGLNAAYFIFGLLFVRNSDRVKIPAGKHLLIAVLTVSGYAAGIWLVVMTRTIAHIGLYVVYGYAAAVCLIYGIVFIWGGKNVLKNKCEVFVLAMNGLGMSSGLLYIITQIHTLEGDNKVFAQNLICGSTVIFMEVLLLVQLFHFFKRDRNKVRLIKNSVSNVRRTLE